MTQRQPKEGFNLSKWALDHPALTRYLMVVLMLLGFAAYFQLGQDEDPPFTFRAMVVRTYWPGATAQQVAEQVTDKIERTLQEVPYADKIRSYSKPGESQIIFQIKDSSKPERGGQRLVQRAQEGGRHALHAAGGVQGPFFNDDFGDVYGVIYALESEGFSYAELKTLPTTCASSCCACPMWPRLSCLACRTKSCSSKSRKSAWRSWAWT
jgi:multidrug efflux pump